MHSLQETLDDEVSFLDELDTKILCFLDDSTRCMCRSRWSGTSQKKPDRDVDVVRWYVLEGAYVD